MGAGAMSLVENLRSRFVERFGATPQIYRAPGRVNLIGEHTDYNDGFVLPMAIDRYTVIAGRNNGGREATVHSLTVGESATIDLTGPVTRGEPSWSNYIRGVIAGFQGRGVHVGGFDAAICSGVPVGGGLSSSAALEVAVATLLESLTGHALGPEEKALLCQKAEHDFARVPCGIMDQFASVLATKDHLLLLDCRSQRAEKVPFSDSSVVVLIINTNVRHKHAGGDYAQRRAQCEEAARRLKVRALRDSTAQSLKAGKTKLDPVVFKRARHVISENERTVKTAKLIRENDFVEVGRLMYASHKSLREDYEVSCAELDIVVEIAASIGLNGGLFGCRMTGGGFGGCTVALVQAGASEAIARQIIKDYERRTRVTPAVFVSRPADGSTIINCN